MDGKRRKTPNSRTLDYNGRNIKNQDLFISFLVDFDL